LQAHNETLKNNSRRPTKIKRTLSKFIIITFCRSRR